MRILSIDIETYSDVDLSKSGVYPYAESDNFEIQMCIRDRSRNETLSDLRKHRLRTANLCG